MFQPAMRRACRGRFEGVVRVLLVGLLAAGCGEADRATPRDADADDVGDDAERDPSQDDPDLRDDPDGSDLTDLGEFDEEGSGGVSIVVTDPAEASPRVLVDAEGDNLVFSVNPEFRGAPAYLWFLNGEEVRGEVSETLVLARSSLSPGLHRIAVVVLSAGGLAHSGELSLTI
jgi:hypothetical protein